MNKNQMLIVALTASFLPACGAEKKNERKAHREEIATLRAENEELRKQQEESNARMQELNADISKLTLSLTKANQAVDERSKDLKASSESLRAAEERRNQIQNELAASSTTNSELTTELAKVNEEISTLNVEVKAKETQLASAKEASVKVQASLAELQAKHKEFEAFANPLLKPILGLWMADLDQGLNSKRVCKLFYDVAGVGFKRIVVCQDRDLTTFKFSVETGTFVDGYRVPATAEAVANLEFHRQFTAALAPTTCQAAAFPQATNTLSWSNGFAAELELNSDSAAAIGLLRGDEERQTATCAQILGRPNRPGLEEAVLACQAFAASSEQHIANKNIGCLSSNGTEAVWSTL